MSCNCNNSFYPFLQASCSGAGNFQYPSGPFSCKNPLSSVRANFTTPAAQSEVIIETTDSANLTVGQGILIGSTFYQITDILDSLNIEAKHNGVGASPGTIIYAVHPTYGCYQYPIIPVGQVVLDVTPTVAGLNAAADTPIASSIVSPTVNQLSFGYVGPTTIQFQYEFQGEIDNSPTWFAFALPVPARTGVPTPAFAAFINEASNPVVAVGKLGVSGYQHYVIVGKGGGTALVDGAGRQIAVSGKYETLV